MVDHALEVFGGDLGLRNTFLVLEGSGQTSRLRELFPGVGDEVLQILVDILDGKARAV